MSDALINGLAGAGGGIIAQLITYPLQTVNARQQTDRGLSNSNGSDGTIKQMCQVVNQEGWGQLYGGLTPSLVGTAASQGVYYYFYQMFRDRAEAASLARQSIGLGDGSIGMLQSLVVAAFAGSVNVLLTNPIWVVVTRMQTHKKTSTSSASLVLPIIQDDVVQDVEPPPYGTIDVVQELYGESGLLGLWKGVFPTLIMVSNPSIQFMLYEAMLKNLKKKRASSTKGAVGLTAFEIFLLGAVAKLGATLVTYPLNVVKARLQAKQCLEMDRRDHYQGTGDAIRKMLQYEGFGSFYKGMRTKIVQSVLAAAILFMVKEELVKASKLLLTRSRVKPSR
ncbi:Peroxisomal nicotinamide adenine dinucleotide carrier [Platanthera guangdongensis]|uniref:Peroxisomal nicotinamide adenine dinucleotide carrier n=1 Tax=Platanthera guangdongensis TaxID=2320717 RepID=A0ABR2LSV8_9ASPA